MKQLFKSNINKMIAVFSLLLIQVVAFAQDDKGSTESTSTTTKTTTTTIWYAQPWVWVVGGVILLIVLVALLRGNSSGTDTHTTVIKD